MPIWTGRTLTILACALVAAPALAAERTFDKQFMVPPGGQLTLDADVGSIAVVGGEGHAVVVHADISGSNDFLSRLHIDAVQNSAGVTVTGRVEPGAWLDRWFESGQHKVLYRIEVPLEYRLDLHTGGGSMDVRHLNASLRGTTSGGSITIQDIRGTTDARTSGGSIRLEHIDGRVRARTSGGSVEAGILSNRGVSLETAGGSITLMLPANVHGSIDAHTSGGRVESAIPVSSTRDSSRNELQGAINGGGELIFLRTSGGSIHIRPLADSSTAE